MKTCGKFSTPITVAFLLPCLNEENTLGTVLDQILELFSNELANFKCSVTVSDNGSTDSSVAIAKAHGAQVVHCSQRGYGAALQYGIANCNQDIVIFADSDGTYNFKEAPLLLHTLISEDLDLVVGSRLKGKISRGAMPWIHRYLGTPVLTIILNALYRTNGTRVTDCNSGFRCMRREAYLSWNVKSNGMEWASEMLIRALRNKARYGEVPVSLSRDFGPRVPHLKTWRDGMRHLLQILLGCPRLFSSTGALLYITSWATLLVGVAGGPFMVGPVSIFGIQTMLVALLTSLYAISIWSVGLYLVALNQNPTPEYAFFLEIEEGTLFWTLIAVIGLVAILFSFIVMKWQENNFVLLALEKETTFLIAFASNALLFISNILTAHLIKRA